MAGGVRGTGCVRAGRVAEDDPFGPDWQPLDGVDAEELWRSLAKEPEPRSVSDALARRAAAWGVALPSFAAPAVAAIDRLVVAGPAAVAALIGVFATTAGLDWAEQVTCIATPPAHRSLALAAGSLLNLTKPTRVLTAAADASDRPGTKLLLSPDAAPAVWLDRCSPALCCGSRLRPIPWRTQAARAAEYDIGEGRRHVQAARAAGTWRGVGTHARKTATASWASDPAPTRRSLAPRHRSGGPTFAQS